MIHIQHKNRNTPTIVSMESFLAEDFFHVMSQLFSEEFIVKEDIFRVCNTSLILTRETSCSKDFFQFVSNISLNSSDEERKDLARRMLVETTNAFKQRVSRLLDSLNTHTKVETEDEMLRLINNVDELQLGGIIVNKSDSLRRVISIPVVESDIQPQYAILIHKNISRLFDIRVCVKGYLNEEQQTCEIQTRFWFVDDVPLLEKMLEGNMFQKVHQVYCADTV